MDFHIGVGLSLPPFTRFAIALFLILIIPSITQRVRMPTCVGFLIAGVLVGPYGLGVFPKHAEVATFFAELGKLLLMFFVGLEIDLEQFSISRVRSLVFGVLTFSLPFATGVAIGWAFGYGPVARILIGSLLASHTLIGYPVVQSHGAVARPAVVITVGATILTDILSLLVLAVCVATFKSGFDARGAAVQVGEIAAFVAVVGVGLGAAGRWLFHQFGRTDEACFALLLVIVSIAATLAEFIDLEGIVGAFLAGLAVNAAVRGSPAKDKLQFLGNVLFVPAFFIVTGFLIDPLCSLPR
jgi:Kef-type K+ transport system membrane component KefB